MFKRRSFLAAGAAVVLIAASSFLGAQIRRARRQHPLPRPSQRAPQLGEVRADAGLGARVRGRTFTYTEDPADLNPAKLAQFDALLIYANHTTIAPEQEKALLEYVEGGKAFLPIHCASFMLPELTGLHRPRRSAVPEARDRRVHGGDRQA